MKPRVAMVALLVRDYDEAIRWFVDVLGFDLIEDSPRGPGKRWVRVAPPGGGGTELLLARAANPEQQAVVGHQGGGRVAWFLYTDDFAADHARLVAHGVRFTGPPRHEPYGTVAVFRDAYGNRWDLLQPKG